MVALNQTKLPRFELTSEQEKRLSEIEWNFHVRAFGEEMARVNFMTVEERKAYLARCRQRARSDKVQNAG